MPLTDQSRSVAYSVLSWLKHVRSTELKDNEELDVAIDCISNTFDVKLDDANSKKFDLQVSIPILVYQEVERRKSAAASGAAIDVQNDEKFKEFIGILTNKGYFANCTEGSAEYNEKMEKAKAKFAQRNNPFEGLTPEQLKVKGNQLIAQNNCAEAINYYNKAIELEPSNAVYYANRAAAFTRLKTYKKAIDDCRKAIVLDPGYSKAHSRLGTALFYEGLYKEAVDAYEVALSLEPNNSAYMDDLKTAKDKLQESTPTGFGGDGSFSFLQNKDFMKMAMDMMAKPEFNNMIQGFAKQLKDGNLDLADMFKSNPFAPAPGDNTIRSPFGDIPREEVEMLQNSPEYRDNPKIQAVLEEAKRDGPSALFKYMGDKEVMDALTGLATRVMSKLGTPSSSSSSNAPDAIEQ
jgi:small glutamine-rich tetratricopeptide repeat-containing protein alpha